MSRISPRRLRLIAVGFVALSLLLGFTALVERFASSPSDGPVLSVHSTSETGARALYLWMAESSYQTSVLEYRSFSLDPKAKLLFVLAPGPNLTDAHAAEIASWVERGGTLVTSAETDGPLLTKLGVKVQPQDKSLGHLVPLQPIFQSLPIRSVETDKASIIEPTRPEWVPFLGPADGGHRVVGAVARIDSGRAFVLAANEPFSNKGLPRADNWLLVRYLLDSVPGGSQVVFDEYHHGLTEHGTLGMRLVNEPWGWAILYSGALLFAYVALSGRRFGAPQGRRIERTRRSRSEYVSTISALLRQGGHREWLCREYASQLRRDLGARYQVPASLAAEEFVARLARTNPEAAGFAPQLRRLEDTSPKDDASATALIREAEDWRFKLSDSSAGDFHPDALIL